MIDFLKGKKTYLVATIGVVVSGLYYTGHIDEVTYKFLMGLLGSGAAATVAAKINRMDKY